MSNPPVHPLLQLLQLALLQGCTIVTVPFSAWYGGQFNARQMKPLNLTLSQKKVISTDLHFLFTLATVITSSLSQATISPYET